MKVRLPTLEQLLKRGFVREASPAILQYYNGKICYVFIDGTYLPNAMIESLGKSYDNVSSPSDSALIFYRASDGKQWYFPKQCLITSKWEVSYG